MLLFCPQQFPINKAGLRGRAPNIHYKLFKFCNGINRPVLFLFEASAEYKILHIFFEISVMSVQHDDVEMLSFNLRMRIMNHFIEIQNFILI